MRLIYIFTLCFLFQNYANAELIDIPDDNLRTHLQSKFPDCFVDDQLDTECADVLAATQLTINAPEVFDYDGLQYFTNVQSLRLDINSKYDIRTSWPPNLVVLNLTGQHIDEFANEGEELFISIYNLPESVRKLSVFGGSDGYTYINMNDLPENLSFLEMSDFVSIDKFPENLDSLVTYNLYEIDNLPQNLKMLELFGQGFWEDDLPEFPATLKSLNIINIISDKLIPELPQGLEVLFSDGTNLITPSTLIPSSLRVFHVIYSDLNELPLLPTGLKEMDVSNNQLTILPTLPNTLEKLNVSSNQLTFIPDLPQGLKDLNVAQNAGITCLPLLPASLQNLNIAGLSFNCIPNETDFIAATPQRPVCTNPAFVCTERTPLISGTLKVDTNNDGEGDFPLAGWIIQSQIPGRFATTKSDGSYSILANLGELNIVSPVIKLSAIESSSPENYSITPAEAGDLTDNYNFVLKARDEQNLEVYVTANAARPGFVNTATVTAINQNFTSVSGAKVVFKKPLDWTLDVASPPADIVSNDSLVWNNLNFAAQQKLQFTIQSTLPATATILGNPFQYTAIVSPVDKDATPENNTAKFEGTIVGSYDPNDKLVNIESLAPDYSDETELLYTIRFQNSGTDTAINVVVIDTILANLDQASIDVIGASHDFIWELKDGGIAVFTFSNIMLPDSNVNEPASHGYVQLTLKPISNLPENAVVKNSAAIFFDFNEAIITNFAQTEIKLTNNIVNKTSININAFPNPSKDNVRVEWAEKGMKTVSLMDYTGRKIQVIKSENGFAEFNVANLSKGLYIITIHSETESGIAKIVVQ